MTDKIKTNQEASKSCIYEPSYKKGFNDAINQFKEMIKRIFPKDIAEYPISNIKELKQKIEEMEKEK